MATANQHRIEKCRTGVEGLDEVLGGGLPRHRVYLLQGDPGVGKTTLAMQFLLAGVKDGEKVLYITLSETREELEQVADSHGWTLNGFEMLELSAVEEQLAAEAHNTLFHPSEVELHETMNVLLKEVERVKPSRLVFDSLSEMRLLTQNPLRYRRQMLALKQFFAGRKCTVLLIDDWATDAPGQQAKTIAHGVIALEHHSPAYGGERRHLRVAKLRGVGFVSGYHDYVIVTGGLRVFPRLVAAQHGVSFTRETISTGLEPLDALLGGGIDRGTSTLIMGPSGAGKTTLALHMALAALDRREHVAAYIFDENRDLLLGRKGQVGERLRDHWRAGHYDIQQIDPAEMSPGQLASSIRHQVEHLGARMVVLDSLNGYLKSMPEERYLTLQLHELLSYLGQRGIMTILVLAQSGLVDDMQSPADLTYLADTVVMLRFFESAGEVKQAISLLKRRTGPHERHIREFRVDVAGVRVGPPLVEFSGVLTGVPTYTGGGDAMLDADHER